MKYWIEFLDNDLLFLGLGSDRGSLSLLFLLVGVTSVKKVSAVGGVLRVDLGETSVSRTIGGMSSDAGNGVVVASVDPCDHAVGLGWVITSGVDRVCDRVLGGCVAGLSAC